MYAMMDATEIEIVEATVKQHRRSVNYRQLCHDLQRAKEDYKVKEPWEEMQHRPRLDVILNTLAKKNKLPEDQFPSIADRMTQTREIVIYIVGGVTYQESRAVREFNVAQEAQDGGAGWRVVLGGDSMLRGKAFCMEATCTQ